MCERLKDIKLRKQCCRQGRKMEILWVLQSDLKWEMEILRRGHLGLCKAIDVFCVRWDISQLCK